MLSCAAKEGGQACPQAKEVEAHLHCIRDGTYFALGYLNVGNAALKGDLNGRVLTIDATKTLFKKAYKCHGVQGISGIFEALTHPDCKVVQLYLGGIGWPFDGKPHLETTCLTEFCRCLPRTRLLVVNMGERDPCKDIQRWWASFLDSVSRSHLGHLWINEQGKGTCPLEVRGKKASKSPTGVVKDPPTGLQLALYRNRDKEEYKSLAKNPLIEIVLKGGLKCWRDYASCCEPKKKKRKMIA